jgi:hypothetical protein
MLAIGLLVSIADIDVTAHQDLPLLQSARFRVVSHRINALGQLYSKLSEANTVEAVDAATYLDELCRDLIASVHKEGGTSRSRSWPRNSASRASTVATTRNTNRYSNVRVGTTNDRLPRSRPHGCAGTSAKSAMAALGVGSCIWRPSTRRCRILANQGLFVCDREYEGAFRAPAS